MPPFAGEVGRGGLLLTREQACGVEIALLDAEEIAREALAKHLRELGEEIARQSHALPPICHAEQAAKGRIADEGQKPANRPETGKANRGWLTAERAKAIGKIGADKFAASKRGKSILPRCVGCLLAIGWGCKRIVRHTGWAKTTVHRWAKFNGLNLRATAEQKKRAASRTRKQARKPDSYMLRAFNAECRILRSQEAKHWPRWTIVKRGVVTVADKMDKYYANHEASKRRSADAARRRYLSMPKGSAEHMRQLLRCRIYNALIRGSADTARTDRKAMPTMQLVGCSMAKLRRHMEAQFSDGMTWANMGKWHIDHIVPCSAFDLSKPENQQRCFNYKNLRPMWASANIRKGNLLFDSKDCLPLRAT